MYWSLLLQLFAQHQHIHSGCIDSNANCLLAHLMDGGIIAAAPLALADHLPLPMIVKRDWSGFVPVRCAI